MKHPLPTNAEKQSVWTAYRERRPTRVPLRWNVNSRILLLNPELNPDGIGYRAYFHDPRVTLQVQSRYQEYVATVLNRTCDGSTDLPERWTFHVENQNVYDAAYFGATVQFEAGQVPCTHQFLGLDDVDAFLARDFAQPLDNPWIQDRLAFHAALTAAARDFQYLGRGGTVAPFTVGFDGPLTVAMNLFGDAIMTLLGEDPERAVRVLTHIVRAAAARNEALAARAGLPARGDWGGTADDSIQLIGPAMYREWILPVHALVYELFSTTVPADMRRSIHLCGDATRHFATIHKELGVVAFDTGFPVDHGRLRDELGADVELSGGPRVDLLLQGTPSDCYEAARGILQSGVMRGGRFILQEANNLPPRVPLANLEAVYDACLDHGWYGRGP